MDSPGRCTLNVTDLIKAFALFIDINAIMVYISGRLSTLQFPNVTSRQLMSDVRCRQQYSKTGGSYINEFTYQLCEQRLDSGTHTMPCIQNHLLPFNWTETDLFDEITMSYQFHAILLPSYFVVTRLAKVV